MSRHSKHSNDRSFYTHAERKQAGYAFTSKEILGSDCFLPFGYCGLSLKAPKNAVCTPDGHIFDREFILEFLLNQKLELQAKQKAYEEQERKKARKEASEKRVEDNREVEDFQRGEQSILSNDHRHKRALDLKVKEEQVEGAPEKKLRKGEMLNVDKADLRAKSFWTKEFTPNAAPMQLQKVDTITRCPMSGKKLRAKDLIPIKFEVVDQKLYEAGGGKGVFCCALSKHSITHQQAVLLKPSGQVILESVYKDIVQKEMKCPISGKPLKESDILKLQMGGTGFSAHNEIEAKSFMGIRSFGGDARTLQGHLPRAGYVGLR